MRTIRRRLMTSYANPDLPIRWQDEQVAAWAKTKNLVTRRDCGRLNYSYQVMDFRGNTELRAFPELAWFDSLNQIGSGCFQGCENLRLTSLPKGLTSIGEGCFLDCENLALTSLPDGLTNIARYAFQGCANLRLTSLPKGLTEVGERTFEDCMALKEMTLPSGVTNLGYKAFGGCIALKKITLPESLMGIDGACFQGCANLVLTSLPEGLTRIGSMALDDCMSITEMTFPSSLKDLKGLVFYPNNAITRLRFLGSTPPTLDENGWAMPQVPTYVPDEAVSTYQEAWKSYNISKLLKPLSEWKE